MGNRPQNGARLSITKRCHHVKAPSILVFAPNLQQFALADEPRRQGQLKHPTRLAALQIGYLNSHLVASRPNPILNRGEVHDLPAAKLCSLLVVVTDALDGRTPIPRQALAGQGSRVSVHRVCGLPMEDSADE
ncbi:MAG TPA: hypothetical protein VFV87_06920 [Pirellulaceae bacterium]|nr:hypothetical protein [Pirellulaceae bacterium]